MEAVAELTAAQVRIVNAVDQGDPVELTDADQELHETLVRVSGSSRLQRMAQTLLVEKRMCLTALQGEVVLRSKSRTRVMNADDFFQGMLMTASPSPMRSSRMPSACEWGMASMNCRVTWVW